MKILFCKISCMKYYKGACDKDIPYNGGSFVDENEIIYGGNYLRYYDKVCELLKIHGYSVIKTKFAKSVTAWIYIGDDDVFNYKNDQRLAIERLGRNIPTYHLLDVLKFLKDNSE